MVHWTAMFTLKLLGALGFAWAVWNLRHVYPLTLLIPATLLFAVVMLPSMRRDFRRSRGRGEDDGIIRTQERRP